MGRNDWFNENLRREVEEESYNRTLEAMRKPMTPLEEKFFGVLSAALIAAVIIFIVVVLVRLTLGIVGVWKF